MRRTCQEWRTLLSSAQVRRTLQKEHGKGPTARFGHSMNYLPCSRAIIITGGRNDELNSKNNTRFFNDIYLFLLDQKTWIEVEYTRDSDGLSHIGNHAGGVVTDHDDYERLLVFGGITNNPGQDVVSVSPQLSNKSYIMTLHQNASKKFYLSQDFLEPSTKSKNKSKL